MLISKENLDGVLSDTSFHMSLRNIKGLWVCRTQGWPREVGCRHRGNRTKNLFGESGSPTHTPLSILYRGPRIVLMVLTKYIPSIYCTYLTIATSYIMSRAKCSSSTHPSSLTGFLFLLLVRLHIPPCLLSICSLGVVLVVPDCHHTI